MLALKEHAPEEIWVPVWAEMSRRDLWFLMRYVLGTQAIPVIKAGHPWAFARVREVQKDPNGHIDIWAREHLKSSIISTGLLNLDVLNDPESTHLILSHVKPIARALARINKLEWETNPLLKKLHPDIFWDDPRKEAAKWAEDDGCILKRESNRREATLESSGLVDGMPVMKHFGVLTYDDVVTTESVNTPEQINKTTEAMRLSFNLGSHGGRKRCIGTRYHMFDTYHEMIENRVFIPRIYPCFNPDGTPALYDVEYLSEKKRDLGHFAWASQMLCNPLAEDVASFNEKWLKYYDTPTEQEAKGKITYILVDPANEKKKDSDYTVLAAVSLGKDGNFYLVDLVRDRLNLTERTEELFEMVMAWKPFDVLYEKYGKDSDIQHIEYVQQRYGYRFNITPVGGRARKEDRIRRLVPIMEHGRFYIPREILYKTKEGIRKDLVKEFIHEELRPWPVAKHDDMLDAISRILDPEIELVWPGKTKFSVQQAKHKDRYERAWEKSQDFVGTWMSA